MALGKTNTDRLNFCVENIYKDIEMGNYNGTGIYSTWNTFQYVAKNLNVWADDTIIGSEIKQNLISLSNTLNDLIYSTCKLNTKLLQFIANQRLLNEDSTNIDRAKAKNMMWHFNNKL